MIRMPCAHLPTQEMPLDHRGFKLGFTEWGPPVVVSSNRVMRGEDFGGEPGQQLRRLATGRGQRNRGSSRTLPRGKEYPLFSFDELNRLKHLWELRTTFRFIRWIKSLETKSLMIDREYSSCFTWILTLSWFVGLQMAIFFHTSS